MQWYHYFSGFWAGMFLANFVPHFVNGISGNGFPTPFSKPRGIGLSSPFVNVVWSLFNLLVGFLLFRTARINADNNLSLFVFFIGIAVMSLFLSKRFVKKHKQ
ncbi:MAG: hypothetical protein QM726_02475 [Chitinophagaceae bacterium]